MEGIRGTVKRPIGRMVRGEGIVGKRVMRIKERRGWSKGAEGSAVISELNGFCLEDWPHHQRGRISPRGRWFLPDHTHDSDGPPRTVDGWIERASVNYEDLSARSQERLCAIPTLPPCRDFQHSKLARGAEPRDPSLQDQRLATIAACVPSSAVELHFLPHALEKGLVDARGASSQDEDPHQHAEDKDAAMIGAPSLAEHG